MEWLTIILVIFAAYLLGSVPTGYWIGLLVAQIDVRTVGSQNIGATNVARNLGLNWGLLVLFLDMAKGALPVVVAANIWPLEGAGSPIIIASVALAAFLGHLSSLFLRFRGGKGVATALGVSVVLIPKAVLPALVVFLIVTWLWRYISLASITAVLSLPILSIIAGYNPIYIGLSSIIALLVLIRHRTNIQALLKGQERKI